MAKVILTHEVQGLGSAGDIVEVKNGFARNYLVPKGFAINWTRGSETQVKTIKAAQDARALASVEDAQALKASLEATKVRIEVKAGAQGRLFGSVKTAAVADAVEAAGIGKIDKRKVSLPAIKSTGEYKAIVHLHEGVDANITLQVVTAR